MTKEVLKRRKLVVLDAHAVIHRAYHALPDFTTSKGIPTGALYGICTMLLKIIEDFDPDYVVAAYDLPGGTFRHEEYSDYKAGRGKADDALVSQMERSKDIFKAFSIPIYSAKGFEADDILGTIVEQTKDIDDLDVVIASGDMDTLQLVDGTKVTVFTFKKGIKDTIIYDEKAVKERFGFAPEYLPDYKGLRGDPSDNIPGVAGVGEKTGGVLISEYKTVEKMYESLKAGKNKTGLTVKMLEKIMAGEADALFSKELSKIRRDAPIEFVLPEKTFRERLEMQKVEALFVELEFKSLRVKVKKDFELEEIAHVDTLAGIDRERVDRAKLALWVLDSNRTNIEDDDILSLTRTSNFDDAEKSIFAQIDKDGLGFVYNEIELPIIPIVKKMHDKGIILDLKYLSQKSKEFGKIIKDLETKIYGYAGFEFNINSPKQMAEVLYDTLGIKPDSGRIKKTAGGARSTREAELQKMKEVHPIIEEILKYRELEKIVSTYIDAFPKYVSDDGRLRATFIPSGTTTGRFSSENPNMQNLPIKSEYGRAIRKAFVAEKGYKLVSFDYSQIELRVAALLSQDEYFIDVFLKGEDIHHAVAKKVFHVDDDGVTPNMRRQAKVINFGILYGMGVNALKENLGSTRAHAEEFHKLYFEQFPKIIGYLKNTEDEAEKKGYTTTLFGRRRYFPDIKSKLPYIQAQAKRMAVNAPIQGTATADIIKLAIRDVEENLAKAGLLEDAVLLLQIHDELVYEVKDAAVDEFVKVVVPAMESVIRKEFVTSMKQVPLKVEYGIGDDLDSIK